MRVKRYFGKTIRQAIQRVREEQGPDAVILSNRQVDGGFEIIAAIDFDEVILNPEPPAATPEARAERAPHALVNRRHEPAHVPLAGGPARQAASAAPSVAAPARAQTEPAAAVTDPALLEMRRELKSMRGILEQQLSGLVWGDVARRDPVIANLMRLLLKLEVSPKLCREIAMELSASRDVQGRTSVPYRDVPMPRAQDAQERPAGGRTPGAADAQTAWRNALASLAHKLPVTDDDILTHGGVVALLGPTGVGKTTTIAKLAARFAVRHGARRVALITTDNYRIGAVEHLRAFARILDVPMRVAADAQELRSAIRDFSDRRLVLIDTAGMSQRDLRLTEQFAMIRQGGEIVRNYLVLSATTRPSGVEDVITAYRSLPLAGCILTKVDEAGSLGGALSLLIKHRLAVAYVSDGQRVPEDLYTARAHRLVSRSVAMMRRESLLAEDESFAMAMGGTVVHA